MVSINGTGHSNGETNGVESSQSIYVSIDAIPYDYKFPLERTALVIIDMQRDFLLEGGFGAIQLGAIHSPEVVKKELKRVRQIIPKVQKLLQCFRDNDMYVFHTREGHEPSMVDCPQPKTRRQLNKPGSKHTMTIGEKGPMGRLLIRGEYGHDIVDELQPLGGEVVIDKPGKGAFYGTNLHTQLSLRGITHLIITGVTTECCVTTTAREANDRGYDCLVLDDCTSGYAIDKHRESSLEMLSISDGLFGWTSLSDEIVKKLDRKNSVVEWDGSLEISKLRAAYKNGLSPIDVVEEVYRRIEAYVDIDDAVWISLTPKEVALKTAESLDIKDLPRKPLWGIPFSIKDSFDVEGEITTAACKSFAYQATFTAPAVKAILEAGAINIGKVNLDQLATGLVGQRSDYGTPSSVFSKDYVSGGSSSGSAVSVAAKLVSFSCATDTAGSGRVPAAFNGIVGYKPTRGLVSTTGIVNCCKSLDCFAVEALSVADAQKILNVTYGFGPLDEFTKVHQNLPPRDTLFDEFKYSTPSQEVLELVDDNFRELYAKSLKKFETIGGKLVSGNYGVFANAGKLLYEGSFVAERVTGVNEWFSHDPEMLPVTKKIYTEAKNHTAVQAYADILSMMQYRKLAFEEFLKYDVLIVPAVPTHPTKAQYQADPLNLNHRLGLFTHYGNVLDLCGITIPAGLTSDGLPFAVTLLGPALRDGLILELARRFTSS